MTSKTGLTEPVKQNSKESIWGQMYARLTFGLERNWNEPQRRTEWRISARPNMLPSPPAITVATSWVIYKSSCIYQQCIRGTCQNIRMIFNNSKSLLNTERYNKAVLCNTLGTLPFIEREKAMRPLGTQQQIVFHGSVFISPTSVDVVICQFRSISLDKWSNTIGAKWKHQSKPSSLGYAFILKWANKSVINVLCALVESA